MTDQEIIIAVAKLDGWLDVKEYDRSFHSPFGDGFTHHTEILGRELSNLGELSPLKPYLASRDAIIPVIEKVDRHTAIKFVCELVVVVSGGQIPQSSPDDAVGKMGCWSLIMATPRQLCIALLKATGNWKEQP